MPFALSSLSRFCLLALVPCVALAEGLAPCAGVTLGWSCEGGQPVARAERTLRDDPSLSYRLLSGGHVISLAPGVRATALPRGPLGDSAVTVVGLPPGEGPCCLSQRSLAPAPEGLCADPQVAAPSDDVIAAPPDVPDQPPEVPRDTPPEVATDFAADIEALSPCPPGAAGHLCRGSVTLTRTIGADTPVLPLTLSATGAADVTLTLGGGAICNGAGPGALFCQLPSDAGGRFDLPLALRAPPAFAAREVTLCLRLGAPEDPSGQVRLVQTALTSLGFDPGPIDGQDGARTLTAAQALAAQMGLAQIATARDPALLAVLGLGLFQDANPVNNRACTTLTLTKTDRPACQPATTVPRGDACACRYARMVQTGAARCACVKGYDLVPGRGCVERLGPRSSGPVAAPTPAPRPEAPPPARSCDAASTVKRNGACVCRYTGMVQSSPSACQCRSGAPVIPGAGCP